MAVARRQTDRRDGAEEKPKPPDNVDPRPSRRSGASRGRLLLATVSGTSVGGGDFSLSAPVAERARNKRIQPDEVLMMGNEPIPTIPTIWCERRESFVVSQGGRSNRSYFRLFPSRVIRPL